MTITSDRIYEKFGPNKETALEFFAIFSRFECALKCLDCQNKAHARNGEDIKVYWNEYADYLFEKEDLFSKIEKESEYLLKNPPKKQIVGEIRWKEVPDDQTNKMRNIFLRVRGVRNNLFHGGKFASGMGWYDRERDQKLAETCLKILNTCLEDKNPVTKAFYDELDLGDYGEMKLRKQPNS